MHLKSIQHQDTSRLADLSTVNENSCGNIQSDLFKANELRKTAVRFKQFKRSRFSSRTSHVAEREQADHLLTQFIGKLAPWQHLIETVEFRHGIIIASCLELHRWFLMINSLLFLPILFFVIIPQAIVPSNPVIHQFNGDFLNRSANNFSCTSFRTCFAFSLFFVTPYQPLIAMKLASFDYYNMQLAYLLSMAALFVIGLCTASGFAFGFQPFSGSVESLPLFAWVFNAWNHGISSEKVASSTKALATHRLKEHLRLAVRRHESLVNKSFVSTICNRKVLAILLFELVFGLLFAATLTAVYYFYDLAEYGGVDGVVVETIGPLLATALPTFFLLSADLTAVGILSGNKEKRLPLYQPWHLFFRAVLFRISAIIVVTYRWTFCFPTRHNLLFSSPKATTTASINSLKYDDGTEQNAIYVFKYINEEPPAFCPNRSDDTGWEVLVGRQVVLLLLFTAGFFLIESLLIFAIAQIRRRRQRTQKTSSSQSNTLFPASRFAAYAVTLDLLSLVGAYFFPPSPALAALLLFITGYSVTALVDPRFNDAPIAFSWNNRRPGMRGSSDDEHVFQATVAIRFLRLFPYIFSGLFYMYIFYSVPVSPNTGILRPPLNSTSEWRPAIKAIREALVMPLVSIPVIGWVVRLLDQPPFAYLIALAVAVAAVFAVARIVAVKRRLDFVTRQLVLAREDSHFLFQELQKAKRRTGIR